MYSQKIRLLILLFIVLASQMVYAKKSGLVSKGSLQGKIVDSTTGEALAWATVTIIDRSAGAHADASGEFIFSNLLPGTYKLQVSHVGYQTKLVEGISIASGETRLIEIKLVPKPTRLKSIVVTPGSYAIMNTEPTVHQSLSREEITTVPQMGDDFFRSVIRLPGLSGNDFSTRFDVRGGEYEEVLVTLDGLEIYEPFHMKDFDGGCISVVDAAAVEEIDLMTGGFSAKYGGKMSGVFNIRSRNIPPGEFRLSGGFSLMNMRALAEGTFNNGRGSWLISLRRGFIDLVLKLVNAAEGIKPRYYDVFGKLNYRVGSNHVLNLDILHAHDDLNYIGEGGSIYDTLISSYGNTYVWLNLNSMLHSRLTAQSILSIGRLDHNRSGQDYHLSTDGPDHIVDDRENSRLVGLKSDWQYEATDEVLMQFGFNSQLLWADYDYSGLRFVYAYEWYDNRWNPYVSQIDTNRVELNPSGQMLGAYVSGRFQIDKPIIAEFGLRYDYASYTGDELISPRLGLVYQAAPETSVRVGWGKYYQTEGIHQVSVVDGETDFFPAQRADHYVAGLEHLFESGIQLRMEAYYKKYSRLRPSHRNTQNRLERFPENELDRQTVNLEGSIARGIELFLRRDIGSKLSWRISYAYAKVEDSVRSIYYLSSGSEVIFNRTLTSPHDIRHTLYLDAIYRPTPSWQLNMAFQYHTGWPYTRLRLVSVETNPGEYINYIVEGRPWADRFEPFHRLDFRLNKFFSVGRGRLKIFAEVLNVFGRKNVRTYQYKALTDENGPVLVVEPDEYWFGRMPSFGISYEVEF